MALEYSDADEAVLCMLQRYRMVMMDDLITGRQDFSYAQLFLAVDRLSRKNLIALHQNGRNYQIRTVSEERPLVLAYQPEELAIHY
ncbi:MAG: hypothetical protein ABIR36_05045 [Nitrospiraceae bacterium]